jgi:hypothetical protein
MDGWMDGRMGEAVIARIELLALKKNGMQCMY